MRGLVRNRWLLFAAAIASLAMAGVVVAAAQTHSNGCIFADGHAYCRMASGKLAPLAWSRRVAVPTLVSWLPDDWSVVVRFRLVALVASAGAAVATGLLTVRLVQGRASRGVTYPAAIVAAGLVCVSPHFVRLALNTPVLVDQAAVLLGLAWCLLVTARSPRLRWMSPLLALVLIPTREAWA